MKDITEQPYIVWTDYGSEGWQTAGFVALREALDFIKRGGHGSPMLLTRRMRLEAVDIEHRKEVDLGYNEMRRIVREALGEAISHEGYASEAQDSHDVDVWAERVELWQDVLDALDRLEAADAMLQARKEAKDG